MPDISNNQHFKQMRALSEIILMASAGQNPGVFMGALALVTAHTINEYYTQVNQPKALKQHFQNIEDIIKSIKKHS